MNATGQGPPRREAFTVQTKLGTRRRTASACGLSDLMLDDRVISNVRGPLAAVVA